MLKSNLVQFLQPSWSLPLVIGVLPGTEHLAPQLLLSLIVQVNWPIIANILLDYSEPLTSSSMIVSMHMTAQSAVELDLGVILNSPTYTNLGISNNFTWIRLAQPSSIALLLMRKHWDLERGLNLAIGGMKDSVPSTTRTAVDFTFATNVQNPGINRPNAIDYIEMPEPTDKNFQLFFTPSSSAGGCKK
jgi:hypothetical protein